MPSPADSRPPALDATVVRNPVPAPDTSPAPAGPDQTVDAPPLREFDPAAFAPSGQVQTCTFRAPTFHPPESLSGSPPSGQVLRNLNDWVEHNRDAVDVGEYKLLRSLGTGSFGTVWEAHCFETGEHVAIKFLSAGDLRWEAMLAEVRFLQAMEGTGGIVTVKQVRRGSETQPPYYVMPRANGGSLADRIDAAGRRPGAAPGDAAPRQALPTDEAVRIFTRVATALAAVHRRGIHHCDLKPRNILLHTVHDGDPPEPLIADFGQAHLATDDTPALGTFFYMPPDQAGAALRKARSDSGWDVYALGAILYEMLTGEPPRKTDAILDDLKATHHLESKLVAYRDGVRAAPPPTAHRKLADPLLAGIIDRCLSLDPAARPRDAGEVVALLKHRAWWRKVRSLLALGTVATVLFMALVGLASYAAAREVYAQAEGDLHREVDGSLTRTAWYGKNTIERAFQDYVAFVEYEADHCPPEVRAALGAAAARAADGPAAIGDREVFDAWLTGINDRGRARWPTTPDRKERTFILLLATAADGPAHAYNLARAGGGVVSPAADRAANPVIFADSYAHRDYFHGAGNRYGEEGVPRPVVRRTHISQTYRSTARDAKTGKYPWRVDVSTPVWSGPGNTGRVIGLLKIGLDVDHHLRELIDMPDDLLRDEQEIARAVNAFVVNDRECWVWHEDGMAAFDAAPDPPRDPDNFDDLAARLAPDLDPARTRPWAVAGSQGWSGEYTDLLQQQEGKGDGAEIAHTLPFYPYATSRYAGPPGEPARPWVFVAQVDKQTVVRRLDEVQRGMFLAGSVLIVTLAGLAVGLWVWLFRLLRGWEFAAHG